MKFKSPYRVYIVVTALVLLIGISSLAYGLMTASITIPCTGSIAIQSVSLLHTSGTELYNSTNNPARLYLTVFHTGQGFHISQSDVQHIANMGFKGVRLFLSWGQFQTAANTINQAYFTNGTGEPGGNAIDDVVNWARDAGLYVLLCPGWSSTWRAPAWAISASGLTTAGDTDTAKQHIDMLNNATVQAGITYLYSFIAHRYASYSNVAFESFNELESVSRPCSANERQLFANFNNMWISAIESNEGPISHIKVLELLYDWSDYNYVLYAPVLSGTHSNVILATHDYPLVRSSYSVADGCANTWATFVHSQGYPWMDTEYSQALGGGFTGLQQATDDLVKYNAVGWGYFVYEYSGNSDNTANVNNPTYAPSILAILQPYMRAS